VPIEATAKTFWNLSGMASRLGKHLLQGLVAPEFEKSAKNARDLVKRHKNGRWSVF
jgi:hypothetical protein